MIIASFVTACPLSVIRTRTGPWARPYTTLDAHGHLGGSCADRRISPLCSWPATRPNRPWGTTHPCGRLDSPQKRACVLGLARTEVAAFSGAPGDVRLDDNLDFVLAGECSRWRKVAADELWLWRAGGPLEVAHASRPGSEGAVTVTLGADRAASHPHTLVPPP
ncbi:cupin domain-containing protein [Streptomyces sp. NPDC023588]|uniref:cupin domain-containing protein n=1 Tax=Streptomyces sp. NPDC023588 TaxID=3154907 RepID=UPI0033CF9B82